MREQVDGQARAQRRRRFAQPRMDPPAQVARPRLLRAVLGALLIAACGDDAIPDGKPTALATGTAGRQGAAAASGGNSDTAPASAGSDAWFPGGLPPPLLVACGTALCASPVAGFGFITACCADEATSTCGTTTPSGGCMKPPAGDPRCPALNFRGIISVPSCCTADGACGLDGAMYGMPGCTDLASASARANAMRILGVSVPEPRPCDPADSTHADAGTEDAGS